MSNSTSSAVQKPGPWFTEPVFDGRDRQNTIYNVSRRLAVPDGKYEYETMADASGRAINFDSNEAARAAIAKAQGASA